MFDRLAGQMGSKLSALYGAVNPALVQAEWAQGLSGFTSDEVERGLLACQTRLFAPTLGEFLHLCRPNLDAEVAWDEAQTGLLARRQGEVWEGCHPAVYRAATALYDSLRQGNLRACRSRWEHALRTEFAKAFGQGVPALPVAAIVDKPRFVPMPDHIRQHLASIGILLNRVAQ